MKDHRKGQLINELRDIALKYWGAQQLRERIAHAILQIFREIDKYKKDLDKAQIKPLYKIKVMITADVKILEGVNENLYAFNREDYVQLTKLVDKTLNNVYGIEEK